MLCLLKCLFGRKRPKFVVKPYLNGTWLIGDARTGMVVDYGLSKRDAEDRVEILR